MKTINKDRLLLRCLEELQLFNDEIGGCDHAVGICACDLRRLIEDIEEALNIRRVQRIEIPDTGTEEAD